MLDEFEGVNTAWRKQEAPFDCLMEDKGVLRFARTPYVESLTPENIRAALLAHKIMPRNALLFITFMLEAGIAPVGGMMQTHYATQIRDRLVKWLRQHSPADPRAEALAAMPTDLAVLTPAWGLSQTNGVQPLSYRDALCGWKLDRKTAQNILNVSGEAALRAGAVVMHNFLFSEGGLDDARKAILLQQMWNEGDLLQF